MNIRSRECQKVKPSFDEFRRGEESAFVEVFTRYRKPILRFLSRRVPNEEDASDLTQEVFIKAHRFRNSYDPRYAFSTWLWTIARNTALDWHRRRKETEEAQAFPGEDLSSPPEADVMADREFNRMILRKVLRVLTAPQRRVIWLRVVHQLSYDEISRKVGLTPSAVKSLIHRSRVVLRGIGPIQSFEPI